MLRPRTADSGEDGYYWPVPNAGAELDDETKAYFWWIGQRNDLSETQIEELWQAYCAYRSSGGAAEGMPIAGQDQHDDMMETIQADREAWMDKWTKEEESDDAG